MRAIWWMVIRISCWIWRRDLETEYQRWERTNRLKNGLYWQGDVQDGMEESISGGRKKKYARPDN